MQATVFNPIQLHLLQMFSRMKSDEELREVQQVLSEYYYKKVAKRADMIWDEMKLDQAKLDEIANIHERLPYWWNDDNKFVDCAITAGATYIVSNDHHFAELEHYDFPKVDVLTLAKFLYVVRKNFF